MAEVTEVVGGAQLPIVIPTDLRVFTTAGALAANTAYGHRVRVAAPVPVTAIKVVCAANASGFNGDGGIFTLVGSTYTKVASSGSVAVAAATTGELTFTLTAPFTFLPGVDYWIDFGCDSATPTFMRIVPGSSAVLLSTTMAIAKASNFPLASFSSPQQSGIILQIWAA